MVEDQPSERDSKYVYLVPIDPIAQPPQPKGVWPWRKWLDAASREQRRVGAMVVVAIALGQVFASITPHKYRAHAILVAAAKKPMSASLLQLGSLTSIPGLDLPSADTSEPLAVLRSRRFAMEFVQNHQLLSELTPHVSISAPLRLWLSEKFGWMSPVDLQDAGRYFQKNILAVNEDKKQGVVEVSITWTDPKDAADWANEVVRDLNDRTRRQAVIDAENRVGFLREELASESILSVQQSISRALESQMQMMALTRSNSDYSFRVIDPALPPKKPVWPDRVWILFASMIVGLAIGVRSAIRRVSVVDNA